MASLQRLSGIILAAETQFQTMRLAIARALQTEAYLYPSTPGLGYLCDDVAQSKQLAYSRIRTRP